MHGKTIKCPVSPSGKVGVKSYKEFLGNEEKQAYEKYQENKKVMLTPKLDKDSKRKLRTATTILPSRQ